VPIEQQVSQNTADIRDLERRTGKMEVQHGRLFEKHVAFEGTVGEKLDSIKETLTINRDKADKYRDKKEADEAEIKSMIVGVQKSLIDEREDIREERQKWWQWIRDSIDGKTIVLIIMIVTAIYAPNAFTQVQRMFAPVPVVDSPAEVTP